MNDMKLRELLLRIRTLRFRRKTDSDLDEEFANHLELQTRKYMDAGVGASEAARRASVDFGAQASVKEECREVRRF